MTKTRLLKRRPATARAFAAAQQHLMAASAILRRYPNVTGVGLGVERRRGRFRLQQPAYVVHVARKRMPRNKRDRLPEELFGVPVDVIERRGAGVRFAAAAFVAPSVNTADYGHLGLIARDPSGALVGLTAGHVATPGVFPVSVPGGVSAVAMSCWDFDDSPHTNGSLLEAHFDTGQDLARIAFSPTPGESVDPRLEGQLRAGLPLPVTSLVPASTPVQLVIPGIDWPQGQLTELDHQGRFDTKSPLGDVQFAGLCMFEFPGISTIEAGWSGALICDGANRPVALLSFGGSTQSSAGQSPHGAAWGWPLAPHYSFWRLSAP